MCNSGGSSFFGGVVATMWTRNVNMGILELQHLNSFNFYDGSQGEKRLNYVSDLRPFVVYKLRDDDTLVPKHVGVGTCCEVCFMICFIIF
jgi:hypothetical protein